MTHLAHTFRHALSRLAAAPQRTLSRVSRTPAAPRSQPPPAYVTARLENLFEALSELPQQPHVAAALELAIDALEAELPCEALAAGVYDIDADEVRFIAARGVGHELLRGTALPRAGCMTAGAAEHACIVGAREVGDFIGSGDVQSTLLLCPILQDGGLLGLLALADPLCAARFEPHDLQLSSYVAEQLGAFIHAHRQRVDGLAEPTS